MHVESNKNQHARGVRAEQGPQRVSYDRTTREQESQEDREAILDSQRLQRTNHLTPGQRWVTLLVIHSYNHNSLLSSKTKQPTTKELSHAFENVMKNYDKKFRPKYGGKLSCSKATKYSNTCLRLHLATYPGIRLSL